jgi:hypothetical protein
MKQQTPDWQAVLERLDRLERQNRLWKGLALVLLVSLGAGVLMGGGDPPAPPLLAARKLQLLDGNGKARAELALNRHGQPTLFFYDGNGKERAELGLGKDGGPEFLGFSKGNKNWMRCGVGDDGGFVNLWNAESKRCFRAGPDGVFLYPRLVLTDEDGKARLIMDTFEDDGVNQPRFALMNAEGTAGRISLVVNQQGPAASFFDKAGKRLSLQMGVNEKQGSFLTAYNRKQEPTFGVTEQGANARQFRKLE